MSGTVKDPDQVFLVIKKTSTQNRNVYCDTSNDIHTPEAVVPSSPLFKYTENFLTKTENFQIKTSDIFHISAQNIHCGYSLEPPQRGGSNECLQSMFF